MAWTVRMRRNSSASAWSRAEGRLSLQEYDDRLRLAYASKTYQELLVLVSDLPRPGLGAAEVHARQQADARREARRLPVALLVLWTIFGSLLLVNLMAFGLVVATADGPVHPWPMWLLVPGVALGAVTIGVQVIRRQSQSGRSR